MARFTIFSVVLLAVAQQGFAQWFWNQPAGNTNLNLPNLTSFNLNTNNQYDPFKMLGGSFGLPNFVNNFLQPSTDAPTTTTTAAPDITLQPNFTASQYAGKWYEIYRSKSIPYETGTDVTANYTLNADGTVTVFNREWIEDAAQSAGGRWNAITGVATTVDNGRLSVKFPYVPPGDYRVLFTNYTSIAVVYSDATPPPFIAAALGQTWKHAWVLGRENTLPTDEIDFALTLLFKIGIDTTNDLLKVRHGVAKYGIV